MIEEIYQEALLATAAYADWGPGIKRVSVDWTDRDE